MYIHIALYTPHFNLNNIFGKFLSVILTTFETDASSKSTNFVPHSSPSDVLQTTTVTPNEDTEAFCLVMGNVYTATIYREITSICSDQITIYYLLLLISNLFYTQELDISPVAFYRGTRDPVWNASAAKTRRSHAAQRTVLR
jgi:hypothetical protein